MMPGPADFVSPVIGNLAVATRAALALGPETAIKTEKTKEENLGLEHAQKPRNFWQKGNQKMRCVRGPQCTQWGLHLCQLPGQMKNVEWYMMRMYLGQLPNNNHTPPQNKKNCGTLPLPAIQQKLNYRKRNQHSENLPLPVSQQGKDDRAGGKEGALSSRPQPLWQCTPGPKRGTTELTGARA